MFNASIKRYSWLYQCPLGKIGVVREMLTTMRRRAWGDRQTPRREGECQVSVAGAESSRARLSAGRGSRRKPYSDRKADSLPVGWRVLPPHLSTETDTLRGEICFCLSNHTTNSTSISQSQLTESQQFTRVKNTHSCAMKDLTDKMEINCTNK